MEEKQRMRREVRRWRAGLDPDDLLARSETLCGHVIASAVFRRARTVACFVSMGREVDTRALLVSGKRIALPRVEAPGRPLAFFEAGSAPLVRSAFGVEEPGPGAVPIAREDLDLVLLPGLAVDREGRRLGYGGGFYDRTLEGLDVPRVMLALSEMVRDQVPAQDHDQRVHAFVTEHGWSLCPGGAELLGP